MQDERKIAERGLPAAPEMEYALLGAILFDNKAFLTYGLASFDERCFSLGATRSVFVSIRKHIIAGNSIDWLMLKTHYETSGRLESVGGANFFYDLSDKYVIRSVMIPEYIAVLKEKYRYRMAIGVAHDITEVSFEQQMNARDLIQKSIGYLEELAEQDTDDALQPVGTYLESQGPPEQMFEQMATLRGINLGFDQWDNATGGLQPKDLIIIAARPSMGKTAWACNVAHNVSVAGKVVAFFTLEQKRETMIRRMLSAAARVDYTTIRKNTLTPHERSLILEQREILSRAPLYLDDTPGMTCSRIRSKCQRLKAQVGQLDLILIDQLSHVNGSDLWERGMQLREVIGKQTKALKRTGQDLGAPVVVFNQLKRADGKGDILPRLTDLKESGNIEEDADLVGFLHRPEYFDRKDESLRGKAQMILAKNREGATAEIDCEYDGAIMRWKDEVATQNSFDDYAGRW